MGYFRQTFLSRICHSLCLSTSKIRVLPRAHNPKVVSSNLTPATTRKALLGTLEGLFCILHKFYHLKLATFHCILVHFSLVGGVKSAYTMPTLITSNFWDFINILFCQIKVWMCIDFGGFAGTMC